MASRFCMGRFHSPKINKKQIKTTLYEKKQKKQKEKNISPAQRARSPPSTKGNQKLKQLNHILTFTQQSQKQIKLFCIYKYKQVCTNSAK